jgi:hypothetical protein
MNPVNASDLLIRPPTMSNVPKQIPRSIPSRLVWDLYKYDAPIISPGAGLVEANFSFVLSTNPQFNLWTQLFDQYCIPLVSVEFDSITPPGQSYSSPVVYTALDFDNAGGISSISAIEQFSSCEKVVLSPEKRFVRSVRPAAKVGISTSGGTIQTAVVAGPVWCDSSNNGVIHYGIRSITSFANAGAVSCTVTMYNAFRNQI